MTNSYADIIIQMEETVNTYNNEYDRSTQVSSHMKSNKYLNYNNQCRLVNLCTINTKILKFCTAVIQYHIAVIFEQGIGIEQNLTLAVRWYQRAANNGHVGAQNSLGILYYAGLGVKQDFVMALTWFKKAASQGNNYAQHSLVKMYGRGIGVEQDYDQAFYWYLKAIGIA